MTFVSGWRSYDQQRTLMSETEKAERGWDYAHQFVAEVRASEHHTGLAIDLGIAGKDQDLICPGFLEYSGGSDAGNVADQFGFIFRYPKHKTEITEISEEPWHYRYVGLPHAQIIADHDWVLEEYAAFFTLIPRPTPIAMMTGNAAGSRGRSRWPKRFRPLKTRRSKAHSWMKRLAYSSKRWILSQFRKAGIGPGSSWTGSRCGTI